MESIKPKQLVRYVSGSFTKFLGVEELMYFSEADIKQLGVKNSAHRARIVSSLVALRDKSDKLKNGEFSYTIFHFDSNYPVNNHVL